MSLSVIRGCIVLANSSNSTSVLKKVSLPSHKKELKSIVAAVVTSLNPLVIHNYVDIELLYSNNFWEDKIKSMLYTALCEGTNMSDEIRPRSRSYAEMVAEVCAKELQTSLNIVKCGTDENVADTIETFNIPKQEYDCFILNKEGNYIALQPYLLPDCVLQAGSDAYDLVFADQDEEFNSTSISGITAEHIRGAGWCMNRNALVWFKLSKEEHYRHIASATVIEGSVPLALEPAPAEQPMVIDTNPVASSSPPPVVEHPMVVDTHHTVPLPPPVIQPQQPFRKLVDSPVQSKVLPPVQAEEPRSPPLVQPEGRQEEIESEEDEEEVEDNETFKMCRENPLTSPRPTYNHAMTPQLSASIGNSNELEFLHLNDSAGDYHASNHNHVFSDVSIPDQLRFSEENENNNNTTTSSSYHPTRIIDEIQFGQFVPGSVNNYNITSSSYPPPRVNPIAEELPLEAIATTKRSLEAIPRKSKPNKKAKPTPAAIPTQATPMLTIPLQTAPILAQIIDHNLYDEIALALMSRTYIKQQIDRTLRSIPLLADALIKYAAVFQKKYNRVLVEDLQRDLRKKSDGEAIQLFVRYFVELHALINSSNNSHNNNNNKPILQHF